MKLNSLILFGLFFSIGILNAQTDFKPGYVINLTGDTLYGQIDYRGDLRMSSICRFKNTDDRIIDYSPNDLMSYRFFDSKYFESRELYGRKVFLEFLIKGKINIYCMRDYNGDHYYLDKEGVTLTEIPYIEDMRIVNNKFVFYKSRKHIGLLITYMQDAPELKSQIESLEKPDHKSMIKLAEDYHNAVCLGEKCIIYEKRLPLFKVSISPVFTLTRDIESNNFFNETGGYLYFWVPRANEKIFFKTGLFYHESYVEGESVDIYKIPLQFQYSYRAHLIQPNISFGVNFMSINHEKYLDNYHTLSLNAGIDYRIFKNICLVTAFNLDFIPSSIETYSIVGGIRIDL